MEKREELDCQKFVQQAVSQLLFGIVKLKFPHQSYKWKKDNIRSVRIYGSSVKRVRRIR